MDHKDAEVGGIQLGRVSVAAAHHRKAEVAAGVHVGRGWTFAVAGRRTIGGCEEQAPSSEQNRWQTSLTEVPPSERNFGLTLPLNVQVVQPLASVVELTVALTAVGGLVTTSCDVESARTRPAPIRQSANRLPAIFGRIISFYCRGPASVQRSGLADKNGDQSVAHAAVRRRCWRRSRSGAFYQSQKENQNHGTDKSGDQ